MFYANPTASKLIKENLAKCLNKIIWENVRITNKKTERLKINLIFRHFFWGKQIETERDKNCNYFVYVVPKVNGTDFSIEGVDIHNSYLIDIIILFKIL